MSNRLELIVGVTNRFTVLLVGDDGDPLDPQVLAGAGAKFNLRIDPLGADALAFQTPDPAHLLVDTTSSSIVVVVLPTDTSGLTTGPYFYQVELDLQDGTVETPIPWAPADVIVGGSATVPPAPFTNTVKIDENYMLPGDLAYFTPGGSPIQGAQVRVYLASDYDAGNLASPVGTTITDAGGGWVDPVLVLPGYSYLARFEKPGEFGPDVARFVA